MSRTSVVAADGAATKPTDAQHKTKIIPPTIVVNGVDGDITGEQHAEEREGSGQAMPQAIPETDRGGDGSSGEGNLVGAA